MKYSTIVTVTIAAVLTGCVSTPSGSVWTVSKNTDPITSVSHCVVASYDSASGVNFTRVGLLYPFVENNSRLGVLVGVSSGGTIRLPVGDILWRVDDKPFRTLKAVDNPGTSTAGYYPSIKTQRGRAKWIGLSGMTQAVTATTTAASGPHAQEMLMEMLNGTSLIFRAAAAAPAYGVPSEASDDVGQFRNGDLRPIPIDDSFRQGLAACGISVQH